MAADGVPVEPRLLAVSLCVRRVNHVLLLACVVQVNVEARNIVPYKDNGTGWDDEF